ncbi:MAG TPA: hypothetical protein VFA26_23070 [Gemmataceae bacterium]|nr:hypothetical protein [Gemmataceae bacterium]
MPAGRLTQAGLVGLWAAGGGAEPWFPLAPPLAGAAFVARAVVAAVACRFGRPRTPPPPGFRPTSPAVP